MLRRWGTQIEIISPIHQCDFLASITCHSGGTILQINRRSHQHSFSHSERSIAAYSRLNRSCPARSGDIERVEQVEADRSQDFTVMFGARSIPVAQSIMPSRSTSKQPKLRRAGSPNLDMISRAFVFSRLHHPAVCRSPEAIHYHCSRYAYRKRLSRSGAKRKKTAWAKRKNAPIVFGGCLLLRKRRDRFCVF